MHTVYKPVCVQLLKLHMPIPQIPSLVPRLPPLERNYCVTFKLALARKNGEFKGHAIIARKGGEPGNEATKYLKAGINCGYLI